MLHLGDVCKISGYEAPIVDLIVGGSPCQDLSIAGARKGMKHADRGDEETTRSGLFMEQIRIVKEMRERDRANGNGGVLTRPRYMVWENVYGAFSSGQPKGADFAAVIEEIIKVAEPGACVCVCVPDGGWKKAGCYYADDGSWSIAWRTHDAQFWGVPQRRRRISLVADFNGLTAPAILFDYEYRGEAARPESYQAERDSGGRSRPEVQPVGEGLSGYSEPGRETRQGAAAGAESGIGGTISFQERAGKPGGAKESSCRMSGQEPCQPSITKASYSIQGGGVTSTGDCGIAKEMAYTLNIVDVHGVAVPE